MRAVAHHTQSCCADWARKVPFPACDSHPAPETDLHATAYAYSRTYIYTYTHADPPGRGAYRVALHVAVRNECWGECRGP
jgi:hypothetical protein